eukprot:TRINITY_DN1288_c0_g1_i1.p1 TRINITY_DN1288_c0_g1~~TRINITY_DN1288_c0_g1_i1.p1  ORF type:complete len:546 (-),score=101.47 TRINITY_DN1288_c0_g1_i1:24-1661(-)
MEELLDPSLSYKNIRNIQDNASGPFIPFIGVSLTDITFINVGNKDTTHGKVNTHKVHLLGKAIQFALQFRSQPPYRIAPDEELLNYMEHLNSLLPDISDEDLYKKSKTVPTYKKDLGPKNLNVGSIRFSSNKIFTLDLTYITDRIIAMSYPAKGGLKGLYKNRMSSVKSYFQQHHPNKHRIYNLTEKTYEPNGLHSLREYPIQENSVPPIYLLEEICADIKQFLDADPENIVSVHCDDGKGRTGVVISSYFIYVGECRTASEALQKFDWTRSNSGQAITFPSQRRYVHYFETLFHDSTLKYKSKYKRAISKIILNFLPNYGPRGLCQPWISITAVETNESMYQSAPLENVTKGDPVEFIIPQVIIDGDVKVDVYHRSSKVLMFSFMFNTLFIGKSGKYRIRKMELDHAHKDEKNKKFPSNFRVDVELSEDIIENEDVIDNRCITCSIPVNVKAPFCIRTENGYYHFSCLVCSECGESSRGDILFKTDVMKCSECDLLDGASSEFFKTCFSCNLPVLAEDTRFLGNDVWHLKCFLCMPEINIIFKS